MAERFAAKRAVQHHDQPIFLELDPELIGGAQVQSHPDSVEVQSFNSLPRYLAAKHLRNATPATKYRKGDESVEG